MSRQTLGLLIGLVLAIALRYWVAAGYEQENLDFASSKRALKEVHETASVLYARLRATGLGDTENEDYNYFFNQNAQKAFLGSVQTATDVKEGSRSRPWEDIKFTITFLEKDVSSRQYIVNFLYNCEVTMQRLRTTRLRLRAADPTATRDKPLPTGSKRDDWWKIENLEFTRRTPVEVGK